jgi:DNA polymerase-3 subunit gamma/tau
VSQALYRRYRPESFDDVIGQQHVTEPLQQALRNDRTHHAYLFSGPRGCGKTTSARILARCLNCTGGKDDRPVPTPCGQCQSCRDLARDGAGSLDVIEIDAASHGGVDDARDLRERAFYAPASSRYKVYIIDEAHMVSREGFNALLKLVEEPPDHVKFVFATTEPDKVMATIRSRVHHYPFRLVPPGELLAYLKQLCAQEGVEVEPSVLSLVVRAGRGSVRDSLSVLDQLLAGAGPGGVTNRLASALLGYTDAALLDDTIDAFAAGHGAAVFTIVDRVIEAGHEPKRFAEDLLERLRDLIVIDAAPDAAASILRDRPADELERMRLQAAHFGAAELSRAADIVNTGLTEMRGATAPRLHLELICARVLLPGAGDEERGLAARLDRLERHISIAQPGAPAISPTAVPPTAVVAPREADSPKQEVRAAAVNAAAEALPAEAPPDEQPAVIAADGSVDLITVRKRWPEVLVAIRDLRRFTWTLLSQNAQVAALEGGRFTLGMVNAGARDSFLTSGSDEIVREALIRVLGVDWKVEAIVDPGAASGTTAGVPAAPRPRPPAAQRPHSNTSTSRTTDRPAQAGQPSGAATPATAADPDGAPSPDDDDADDAGVTSHDLLARELGARVIGEYENS